MNKKSPDGKLPYEAPDAIEQDLNFTPIDNGMGTLYRAHRSPLNNESVAEDIFLKKGAIRGMTVANEKDILRKLIDAGVSVEVPFEGGEEDKMVVLGSGVVLWDNIISFSQEQKKNIFRQLGEQIARVHNASIAHGDFHLKNVVVEPQSTKVTLIDFGNAKIIESETERIMETDLDLDNILVHIQHVIDKRESSALVTEFINSYLAHINLNNKKKKRLEIELSHYLEDKTL